MNISNIIIGNRTRKHLGDIQQLANSITTIGLLHPVVVTPDNRLVAGYRRIMAYKLLGRDDIPHVTVSDLQDLLFTLAEQHENTCRLDFTPSEAVEIGKAVEPFEREEAKKRQLSQLKQNRSENFSTRNNGTCRALDKVASIAGLSRPTYIKAKKVVEFAQENPDYQYIVKEMDETGKVDRAAKEMNRVVKLEERKRLTPTSIDSNVWHGDFRQYLKKIPPNSVDLIFTDPPYNEDSIELYRDLGKFASVVLKPGGLCLAYSGQIHLNRVINAMDESLEYMWCFAVQHSGQRTQIYARKISNVWKPVLAYCKPPLDVWWKTMPDMKTGTQDKDNHEWQQSLDEAKFYLSNLCPVGGLVIDPFAGSGTTLVAAKSMGLQYIGIEEDAEDCQEASRRLSDQETND